MALANRLVGNASLTPALETTLTGVTLRSECDTTVAITGASAKCTLNGECVAQHQTITLQHGDVLGIGSAEDGVRSYVAVAGGVGGDEVLGSKSTYLTAGFGGFGGRAFEAGDIVELGKSSQVTPFLETPPEFRPAMPDAWTVRAGVSCETSSLRNPQSLFEQRLLIASRSDRMGIKLQGEPFVTDGDGQMPSVPVFPGTIQCPQDGNLFILSVDSGTTGGYPRVAKIARMDMHILGQLRPGNTLTLIQRSDEDAARELCEKHTYWQRWLADIAEVI